MKFVQQKITRIYKHLKEVKLELSKIPENKTNKLLKQWEVVKKEIEDIYVEGIKELNTAQWQI